nr:hypothetical protein [Tanacetum cinerariifolium]
TCNVAEISLQPLQPLIPPSREVNANDSADKSLFETSVPPITQSKATTVRKPMNKTISSSTRQEALNSSRIETSSSLQATHLQPSEEFVVTADETKSLDVSESAGAQENQNETAEAEKVLNKIVKEKEKAEDHSLDIPTIEQLLDESFQASQITKDVEVTLMGSEPMDMDLQTADSEFELESMPDNDLQSLSGFETSVSDSSHDVSHSEHTSWEKTAFAEFQNLISHSLKAQLPRLLSDALKNSLPQLLKESLTPLIPFVSESVTKEQAQLNKRVVKHMNRQFNIAHKAESLRVSLGMQDVRDDLISQTKHLSKYFLSVQDMHSQLQEVRRTLEAAAIMDDHAKGEKSKKGQMDENANPETTQGEHSNVKENHMMKTAPHQE